MTKAQTITLGVTPKRARLEVVGFVTTTSERVGRLEERDVVVCCGTHDALAKLDRYFFPEIA